MRAASAPAAILRQCSRRLDRRDHQGNGATLAVSQGMDLGGASAARAPNRLITLPPLPPEAQRCALTAELSMRTCVGGPPATAKARKILIHTPFAAHRTKRL